MRQVERAVSLTNRDAGAHGEPDRKTDAAITADGDVNLSLALLPRELFCRTLRAVRAAHKNLRPEGVRIFFGLKEPGRNRSIKRTVLIMPLRTIKLEQKQKGIFSRKTIVQELISRVGRCLKEDAAVFSHCPVRAKMNEIRRAFPHDFGRDAARV